MRPSGRKSRSFLRKRARERHREQERFIVLLRTGLTIRDALEFCGRHTSWLYNLRVLDPVFSERVSILDSINRGLDHRQPRKVQIRYRPHHLWTSQYTTARQSQKAYEDLVDLRQKQAFLEMYKAGTLRTEAAHKLGLATIEILDAMKTDREFARQIESIQLAKLWDAEDAMYERSKESGVDARFLMKKLTEQIEATAPPKRKTGTGNKGPSWA